MSSGAESGLRFPCRELVEEIAAIEDMARGFLEQGGALAALRQALEQVGRGSAGAVPQIELQPLVTVPTRDYEPGPRSGGDAVWARMTGVWEVRPVGGGRPKSEIAFTGKASAVVELWPDECCGPGSPESSRRMAMWRIEHGAHDSPGSYFHFQVLGDRTENPFPKSIPIPRLPSPFVTPMAAVEFVLGELFQDRWLRRASQSGHHAPRWRSIQLGRWARLMEWQTKAVEDGDSSPWMNLKAAKPPDDLFIAS